MDFKLKKSNLNFRVYTAALLPSTGSENDICVISEVPMKNWIMSPDKPSGAPRNDGDVWIQYSVTGNTFNILKNNTMLIATIKAWQYVDGAWVDTVARSYQNGVWVSWIADVYLYNSGDECTDITGGWSMVSNDGNKSMGLTKTNGYLNITVSWSGTYTAYSSTSTANTVDVSKHSKLNILYDFSASAGTFAGTGSPYQSLSIGLGSSKTSASSPVSLDKGTNLTATLDISSFDGAFYVVVRSSNYCTSGNVNIKIHKVWLSN